MEPKIRHSIRLPDELYDEVMEQAGNNATAQDFVQDATRFWLGVAQTSGDALPRLTPSQEALARRLLHFLFATNSRQREAILMLMEDWYERRDQRP